MSEIQIERSEQGVATVWLSNPKHLNALSNSMIIGLCEELPRLADDMTCRAIVMRGRGGVFCAGRELSDVKALQGADLDAVEKMYGYMQKMNEVIYYSPHPVISVVEKYAFGIATMLVLDGLAWLARHGVSQAIVNTQEHNDGALALYQHLGFRLQPGGLAVLQTALV